VWDILKAELEKEVSSSLIPVDEGFSTLTEDDEGFLYVVEKDEVNLLLFWNRNTVRNWSSVP